MLSSAHQRFRAIEPGLSNPLCVTVGFTGLGNSFDLATSRARGVGWSTDTASEVGLDVPVIPHQVEAAAPARGVFDDGDGIVTYGGRGFAVPARVEPEVLAYGIGLAGFNRSGGQGGEFAVTLEAVADENDGSKTSHWRVASATAQAGVGSGYSSTGFVTVAVGDSICASPPTITLGVGRGQPKLTARPDTAACNCAGSGAEFEIAYTQTGSGSSVTWAVSSIQVLNGGTGYPASGSLAFSQGLDGQPSFGSLPTATFQSTAGVITSVSVASGGATYTDGVPTGTVTVSNTVRGAFYKEDRTLPVYTYSEYASEYQIVVDTGLESDTFGQVTEGPPQEEEEDDGPPYECRNGCLASYNDKEYVLCTLGSLASSIDVQRADDAAVRLCVFSPFGQGGQLKIVVPDDYDNGPTGIDEVEVVTAGTGYAVRGRSEPSPVFGAFPGSGVSFSPSLTQSTDSGGRPIWSIASVTVSGGSGYTDRSGVFMPSGSNPGIGGSNAVGRLNTTRIEPALSATPCAGSGSGATLVVELSATGDDLPVWSVSAVTVTDGGSGYVQGSPISFSVTSPSTRTTQAACATAQVDESGAIVSVVILRPGDYYRHTGTPHSVSFDIPGETTRGAFFLNNDSLPVITATIEVKISQNEWFSQGAGAVIVANVDTNPSSATFGRILSASVQDAGSGYKLRSAPRQSVTLFGQPAARLLGTRRGPPPNPFDPFSRLIAPVTATEFSVAYYNYLTSFNSSIEAHVTAPDCNGVRKAEVIVSEPGYDIVDSFRTDDNICARAFVGEGAEETIELTPVDGLGGTAYLRLEGDNNGMELLKYPGADSNVARGLNCRGRLEDDCEICRTPRKADETSQAFVPGVLIPELFPLPGSCVWQGEGSPPSNPQPPVYWADLDDEGDVLSWYKMCGSCPEGFAEEPPGDESILYSRTRCECDFEASLPWGPELAAGFCFWKPADCESGEIEFDKSTCTNPFP